MGVWSERFLWIHVAGLAMLPMTLGFCLCGFCCFMVDVLSLARATPAR